MRALFILLIISLLVSSCQKEEDVDCLEPASHALDGEWNLINVSCECAPVILEPGEHIWTMDVAAGSLVVEDLTTEDWHTIPESGSYNLIVTANDSLYYELPYGYIYYFENGDLYLDQQSESDGPLVRLTRP